MNLLVILFALGAEKLFPGIQGARRYDWLMDFGNWLRENLPNVRMGAAYVLLTIGIPAFTVGLAYWLLDHTHMLLGFTFSVAVLLYCLGPKSLDDQIQVYLKAREAGESARAHQAATEILHEDIPATNFEMTRAVIESILLQANERLLGVLFWFILLGPLGALLYRLAVVLKSETRTERTTSDFAQAARRLYATLNWPTARLVALSYATIGNFVDALTEWRNAAAEWREGWEEFNARLLVASGLGALQIESGTALEGDSQTEIHHVEAAQALVWRSLMVWLVIIALLTLAGWVGIR